MTDMPVFRAATEADLDALIALNDAAVPHVNALTRSAWLEFLRGTATIRVARAADGRIAALLVALPPGCGYGSENYRWFERRLSRFVYVDRIVVDPAWRGRGLGAACYADLGAVMRGGDAPILCEVNLRPANDASLAFHGKQGFREIGVQSVYGDTRRVVMLARRPGGPAEPSLPGPDDGCALRRAAVGDVPDIVALAGDLLAELGAPASIDRDAVAHSFASERLVAVVAHDQAGLAQAMVVLSEAASVYASGSFGVITELFVRPALRGRGLGARLVAAARREARWRGWRRLEVTTPDDARFAATQRFYRVNDFTAIGTRRRLLLG